MSDLKAVTLAAPTGGIDLLSAPDAMPADCALWLENLLLHAPGKVPVRGPVTEIAVDERTGADNPPVALVDCHDSSGDVLVTRGTDGKVTPEKVLTDPAASSSDLDTTDGTYLLGDDDPITEFGTSNACSIAGSAVRAGGNIYGFSYENTSSHSTTSADGYTDGPVQWTRPFIYIPSTHNTAVIYDLTAAPVCGQDVVLWLDRLWVFGGFGPGAPPQPWEPDSLFFSDELPVTGALANSSNAWKDDVSGLVNRIVVGERDDWLVGGAVVDQNLVIFKSGSLWSLYGSSPDSFTLRCVSQELGCVDRRSIVQADGGVYWMSRQGYQFYDGSQITNVGAPVQPLFQAYASAQADITRCVAGCVGQDYLAVMPGELQVMLLHRPTRTWTSLNGSDIDKSGLPGLRGRWMMGDTFASTDSVQHDLLDRGAVASSEQFINCDASAILRPAPLARPAQSVQLHRVMVDTIATAHATSDEDAPTGVWAIEGWPSVGPIDATDELFSVSADAQASPLVTVLGSAVPPAITSAYVLGRHAVVDTFVETDDVIVLAKYTNPADTNMLAAELRDITIEFQVTRQRRTSAPRTIPT